MLVVLWRCLSCPYLGQAGVCAGCFPPADGAVQRPAGPRWEDCLSAEITTRGCGAHQGWNISSLHGKTHSQVDDAYSWKYSFSDKMWSFRFGSESINYTLPLAVCFYWLETRCSLLFSVVPFWWFLQLAQCFRLTVALSQWVLRDEPEATKKLMSFSEKCLSQSVH